MARTRPWNLGAAAGGPGRSPGAAVRSYSALVWLVAAVLVAAGAAGCAATRPLAEPPDPGRSPTGPSRAESSPTAPSRTETSPTKPSHAQVGMASYYAPRFHGRRTASGEVFDAHELTAAHPTLPFGTRVRVTNLENGRRIVVRINDRGPFKRERILDLSRAAARMLGFTRQGTARVRLEVL